MNKDVIILDILETHIKNEKCLSPINQKCLLEYVEDLQKKAELADHYKHLYSEVKKQKDDVVEYIKKNLTVGSILDGKKTYVLNDYTFDYKDLLRMLGEINE